MPLEEQTTQAVKETTETVARVGVRLTAQGVQAFIHAVFGVGKAGVHKAHQAYVKHRDTGKMSLKRLNQKTGGATSSLEIDIKTADAIAKNLKKSGIDFHISQDKKNDKGIVHFPAQASPFVQDILSRTVTNMSRDDINKTIMDAQETAQELKNPDMEEVSDTSLNREAGELKEAGISVEPEPEMTQAQPDYWQTTPATERQTALIHDQVAQGFIPKTEAQEFLNSQPTIAQANEFLNQHPNTVDHLDLYGKDNITTVKKAKNGAKLTKKDVQQAIKKGATARGEAHHTVKRTHIRSMKPAVKK